MKKLKDVVAALEAIAPLEYAEDWDNVGLLVEPPKRRSVKRILLTVDLTTAVMAEAKRRRAEMIVAYHPPIFGGMNRLVTSDVKQRIVLEAIAAGIAIHSPHTALDAAPGGVNDWLADAFGPGDRRAILASPAHEDDTTIGQGRALVLQRPSSLANIIRRVKRHLGLQRLRVATAARHEKGDPVSTVALCAGAGGSVVGGEDCDLIWTGEMRHHDVLAAVEHGTSVILCDHTNTERGYLAVLQERLIDALAPVAVEISGEDAEPLVVK